MGSELLLSLDVGSDGGTALKFQLQEKQTDVAWVQEGESHGGSCAREMAEAFTHAA